MSRLNAPLITLIEVARLGSLRRAAGVLNVTQAAVTTRIKSLEAALGFPLLVRRRNGASLTTQGAVFLEYAQTAVTAIAQGEEAARRTPTFAGHLRFMSQFLLLESFALDWVGWMQANAPGISLSIDSGYSEHAAGYIAAGLLDLAIGYQERKVQGVVFEPLFNERLVLVTSCPKLSEWRSNFIAIEWDDNFVAAQRADLGDLGATSPLRAPFAEAARLLLSRCAGSAYVVERVARAQLEAGTLKRVPGARTYTRPAFAVYPANPVRNDVLQRALDGLRTVARTRRRPPHPRSRQRRPRPVAPPPGPGGR